MQMKLQGQIPRLPTLTTKHLFAHDSSAEEQVMAQIFRIGQSNLYNYWGHSAEWKETGARQRSMCSAWVAFPGSLGLADEMLVGVGKMPWGAAGCSTSKHVTTKQNQRQPLDKQAISPDDYISDRCAVL